MPSKDKRSSRKTSSKKTRSQGTVALKEIREEQKKTDLIFPKAPFERLVREVAQNYKTDLRFSSEALEAIQESAEDYLIKLFYYTNLVALHDGETVTIAPRDMKLVRHIRGE